MFCLIVSLAVCANPNVEDHLDSYFVVYRGSNGLIQDRATTPNIFSIPATGFGMDVWAIMAKDGKMPKAQALQLINRALDFAEYKNQKKNRGWLYHFVDGNGLPRLNSEVSTIDTAIFFLGAKQAAERLGDQKLRDRVSRAIAEIDGKWMMANSPSQKLFCHGLHWEKNRAVFIAQEWGDNSEGVLVYRLFGIPFKPVYSRLDLPLFVYYFPMCFLAKEEFLPSLKAAINYQKTFFGHSGITATDTETGYEAYPQNHISPLCLYAISPFVSSKRRN